MGWGGGLLACSLCFLPSAGAQTSEPVRFYIAPWVTLPVRRVAEPVSPKIALKTNLLFDAATILNAEVEVAVAQDWSVAGEWIFPWWLLENKQNAGQLGIGTLEGRRWWNRCGEVPLTGWFTGVYVGLGYYDLEWEREGIQGEGLHAGISGGYAHTINWSGNLRLEYALGLGVMYSKYRRYTARQAGDEWLLERQYSGTSRWLGPTRAKVSLVWLPDWKRDGL